MGHAGEGAVILRGCGAAVLCTGGTSGCEKPLALKASFIVLFLVAEHPIIYKTLKAVVLKVLAYEPDFFFFSSGGTGTCKANLLSPNVLKRCP